MNTEILLNWILDKGNRDKFATSPGYQKSGHVVGIKHLQIPTPELKAHGFPFLAIRETADYLLEYFDLSDSCEIEPNFGYLLCYSEEGHEVQVHKDPNNNLVGEDQRTQEFKGSNYLEDKVHVRLNMLLSKSEKGGDPIINGKVIKVDVNEPWMCLAGVYPHSTTITEGKTPRVLLSLGYFIPTHLAQLRGWLDEIPKNIT